MAVDVTDATFEKEVIERSKEVPVLIDLWAPWCQPCRILGPILEKVVGATDGKVVLAKVDTEQNGEIAAAFKARSIPVVYVMVDGEVVDGFRGALPEHEVQAFVDKILEGGETTEEVESLIAAGDEESLRKALKIDSENSDVALLLAKVLLDDDKPSEAIAALAPLAGDEKVKGALAAARETLLAPEDQSEKESKLKTLLTKAKANETDRAEFLKILDELADVDPDSVAEWRKKLSTALY